MRGIMHWMSGLTLFWLLIASLWMPWIDYGKTYRDVSASLRAALPDKPDCIAGSALPLSFIASLDYFEGIRTVPQKHPDAARCSWLLVQGTVREPSSLSEAGWRKTWEGNRPTDRRTRDKFHLYQRGKKSNPAPELRDLSLDAEEPDGFAPPRRQPD